MKQWHRIDHNTKAETVASPGRVQAACEVQLNLTKQGARDLMAASVLNDGVIILGNARFEWRA